VRASSVTDTTYTYQRVRILHGMKEGWLVQNLKSEQVVDCTHGAEMIVLLLKQLWRG
jgi:hypothetical protein